MFTHFHDKNYVLNFKTVVPLTLPTLLPYYALLSGRPFSAPFSLPPKPKRYHQLQILGGSLGTCHLGWMERLGFPVSSSLTLRGDDGGVSLKAKLADKI